MFLVRLILFAVGASVSGMCLFILCLECELCVRTLHPVLLGWSAFGAVVWGAAYYAYIGIGYRSVPELFPSIDSLVVAIGVWFPFALQACLAAWL